jgi:hypothetical protein
LLIRSSLVFALIVSAELKRLIKAPTTIDIPTIIRTARLLIVPRNIAEIEKRAAIAPLANPIANNRVGWRSCLSGEKETSTNAVMPGAKKMPIPIIVSRSSAIIFSWGRTTTGLGTF